MDDPGSTALAASGPDTLSLLGPGSLEPVRLVSVFASIGSILRSSSVVHPSSTLFFLHYPSSLPSHPFDRVNASLSSLLYLPSIGIFLHRFHRFLRPDILSVLVDPCNLVAVNRHYFRIILNKSVTLLIKLSS